MAALDPGTMAPDFWLPDLQDERHSFAEFLRKGPLLLYFFKTNCPTCQLASPYVEKLQQAYGDACQIVGIAQDGPEQALAYANQYGQTFLQLAEEPPYPVSSRFGLTNVPSLFLIGADGVILETLVGWDRDRFNHLAARVAILAAKAPFDLAGDEAPRFKPG